MVDPTPKLTVKATYLRPLTLGLDIDPENALRRLKGEMLRRIKVKLTQTAFSDRAKRALAKAITIEVKGSSLRIVARHPAWKPLVEGQRAGQMKWLVKAKAPIPIITETGELIFRSATPRSMANGKWVHPGRAPSNFVEKARQEAREFLRDKLYREYVNQIRKAVAKRR
jgi:hypothetical protein